MKLSRVVLATVGDMSLDGRWVVVSTASLRDYHQRILGWYDRYLNPEEKGAVTQNGR